MFFLVLEIHLDCFEAVLGKLNHCLLCSDCSVGLSISDSMLSTDFEHG